MRKSNYIRFKTSWWKLLRAQTQEIGFEIFCAICVYAIDGEEPELSERAASVFAIIRNDINEQIAHDEQVSEARRKVGRIGAAKTNPLRWGQKSAIADNAGTKSAIADNYTEIYAETTGKSAEKSAIADNSHTKSAITDNAGTKSAIADNYALFSAVPPDPPTMQINNIYNYILTHSLNAHARGFETVLGWLVDDIERLKLEFYRLQLITSTDDEECARVILPYIDAYFEQNDFSADWDRKGRKDTKAHFSSWVRKHKKLEENGTTTETKPAGKQRTTARDAYNAALLGISLADAERSDPEK